MKIRVVGTGDAFDAHHGNTAYLLSGEGLPTLLFDCGYQVPERIWRSPALEHGIEGVYLTHLHADHSFGLVALVGRFAEENRAKRLRLIGPRGLRSFVFRLLQHGFPGLAYQLPFELVYTELQDGETTQWGPLTLRCARTFHSILNLSVRIDIAAPELPLRRASFGVSGTGRLTPEVMELFGGVDLLLQESRTLERYGLSPHCDLMSVIEFAARAGGIKEIGLAHIHASERADIERFVRQVNAEEGPTGTHWRVLVDDEELDLAEIAKRSKPAPRARERELGTGT